MGGRHPLGQFALVLLAVIGAVASGIRAWQQQEPLVWKLTPGHGMLLAAIALVTLQLAPPAGMAVAFSFAAAQRLATAVVWRRKRCRHGALATGYGCAQ